MGQEDEVLSAMGCAFATVSPQQGQASHTDTHEHAHLNLPLKFGSLFFETIFWSRRSTCMCGCEARGCP